MAKQSNFPDNVHVGSPEHDRMVCEITDELLSNQIAEVDSFLKNRNSIIGYNISAYTSETKKNLLRMSNLWELLKAHAVPDVLTENYQQEIWVEMQKEFDSIRTAGLKPNSLSYSYELPVVNKGNGDYKTIVGYWDVVVYLKADQKEKEYFYTRYEPVPSIRAIYVEVKPQVESLGALLRQVNLYRQFTVSDYDRVYIYTPDLRFEKQLQSQDIGILVANESEHYKGLHL